MRRLPRLWLEFTEAPLEPVSGWDAFWWWEARRIPFNLLMGAYGLVGLCVFWWALQSSGHLAPGEDAVEPLAVMAAPIAVNALYTLGWLVEVPARVFMPRLSPETGPSLLKAGVTIGLILISVPPAYWCGVRVLQVLGFAQ